MIFAAAVIALVQPHRAEKPGNPSEPLATGTVAPGASGNGQRGTLVPKQMAARMSAAAEVQQPARFVLRVVNKEGGAGIAGARIRAAYFYAGGVGEGHSVQTDGDGNAPIPEPDHPEKSVGLNIFASLEGYVPLAVNLHGKEARSNFVLELEPALAVGGTVVDEQGLPVDGVELQAQRGQADEFSFDAPNTDFQTSKVTTDENGRWHFPHVPKSYGAINFTLTRSNYAITLFTVPVTNQESLNATLVIERGFAAMGRVTDADGQPDAGATVRESHNFGYRQLSSGTDADGFYALRGLSLPQQKLVNFAEPLRPKATATAPELPVVLVVEAKGMAPQQRTIQLAEPTNQVNFTLAKGSVFWGRIVDEAGNPIPGAAVRTDFDSQNQVPDPFKWLTHTDGDGRFEWDSAPAQMVHFWFEADGYEVVRDCPILPDGTDHEIKLIQKGQHDATGATGALS